MIVDDLEFNKNKYGYYVGPRSIGRMPYHRYVWEKNNGPIPNGMVIHHIDSDKENNDISNLQMMTQGEHASYHGSHITDDVRAKMSIAKSGETNYWYGKDRSGKNSPMYGRKHSEETRFKQGVDKIKYVVCLDTGDVYISLKSAFKKTGVHNISKVCRGLQEKAGGLRWAYYTGE